MNLRLTIVIYIIIFPKELEEVLTEVFFLIALFVTIFRYSMGEGLLVVC